MDDIIGPGGLKPVASLTFEPGASGERGYALMGDAAVAVAEGRSALSVRQGHVNLGVVQELAGLGAMSVAFDFNRAESRGRMTLLFRLKDNYSVSITDDRFIVRIVGSDGLVHVYTSEPRVIANGDWTSVALSFDRAGGAIRLHVDGALALAVDDAPLRFTTIAREAMFGGAPDFGTGFVGRVDDLRIFAGALDAAQVARLARADEPASALAPAPDEAVAAPGEAARIDVLANDAGAGPLRLMSAEAERGGAVAVEGGLLRYAPAPGYFGEDRVVYTVADAAGATAQAELRVTVGVVARDAADLAQALAAAKGGELILLAPGDYGALALDARARPNLAFAEEVTLRSLDPGQMARFTGLTLHSARNLTFEAIRFDYEAAPGAIDAVKPFQITNAAAVTIRDSVFDGALAVSADVARAGFGTGHGLTVRGSRDIAVEGNEFFHWHRAAVFDGVDDLSVARNLVREVRSDGFNFTDVREVAITQNIFRDFRTSPATGDHADMIQFWTTGKTRPTTDILIARNILDAADGDATQSIFMRNEEVDNGRAGSEMFYRNLRIEDNLIRNAHLHGVTVGETDGLVIANNTVVHSMAVASGQSVHVPRINVAEASLDVTVTRNLAAAVPAARAGWSVSDNLAIQRERPDAAGYFGDVFADGLADHRPAQEALRTMPGFAAFGASIATVGAGHAAPYAFIEAAPGEGLLRSAMAFRIGGVVDAAGPVSLAGATARWDFGDGAGGAGLSASHLYGAAGRHEASALVTLADGRQVEARRMVEAQTPVAIMATFEQGFDDLSGPANAVVRAEGASLVAAGGDGAARLQGGASSLAYARGPEFLGNAAFTLMLDYRKDLPATGGKLVQVPGGFGLSLGADWLRAEVTTELGLARLDHRAASLRSDAWRHVAFTFDGEAGTARLYLDGVRVAERAGVGTVQPGSASHDLHLGSPFGGAFAGLVDNFTFLTGAMTQAQIAAHVAAERPETPAELLADLLPGGLAALPDPW